MPKYGSAGTVHTSIVKRLRKDGSRYVQQVQSVYDPKTKNSKIISSKTLGILPPGEIDLSKLIPSDSRKRSAKKQAESMAEKAAVIKDPRRQSLVKYPLDLVLLVVVLAGLAGYTSCRQIAEYWRVHRQLLSVWFDNCPEEDISHDTVRNALKIVGKTDANQFITQFTQPLVEFFKTRILALDGQAVRAASCAEHKVHSRYVLNLYDTDNELCLQQVLIEEKNNEITEAVNIVKSLDLSGAVVTCDAMNTQRKFARLLIEEKHCDYCFAVKKNHEELLAHVEGWFNTQRGKDEARTFLREEDGHGRVEEREIRVLPASLLKEFAQDVLDKWAGLEDGCIVMARTKRTFKNGTGQATDEVRYFITSLNFDRHYIAAVMARIIRRHWMIENSLHWVLDVTFGQDRTQCRNADFLAGKTALNKVIFNLMSKAQTVEEMETGRAASYKPSLKVRFSVPTDAMKLLIKLYRAELQ